MARDLNSILELSTYFADFTYLQQRVNNVTSKDFFLVNVEFLPSFFM